MLRYVNTTVFNVGVQTVVNTVNCVGVMGAGLALECQLRFPKMEKDYVERCQQKQVEIGKPYLYREYIDPWILNFPTKNHWRYPSKIEWIEQSLKYFSANYQKGGITSIAFPKLGCSNGELEWEIVSPLMKKYLQDLDIDVFICEDTEREASGTEGMMVEMLNNIESLPWSAELGIRADIKKKIISIIPVSRFRDLKKVQGIGKQTYNDVFVCLYSLANYNKKIDSTQKSKVVNLNLFKDFDIPLVHNKGEIGNCSRIIESEQIETFDNGLEVGKHSNHKQVINQLDNLAEFDDAFHIILPYIEKLLNVGQTKDQIADRFKLPKKLVGSWLEEAEKIGKISKISHRPVRYIATSSISSEQLKCSFIS